jgi:MFS transporter, DHA3 family, tetracycline resistance protein
VALRNRLSWAGGRRLLEPFSHPEYRALIASLALSVTAGGMWSVVMPMQVIELHDDPAALSLVSTCYGAAAVASVLVGGVAADRFSQRRIIVAVQSVNFLVVAALAASAVARQLQLWHIAVGSALLGLCTGLFYPAFNAYLPRILTEEQLAAANGVEGIMRPALQSAVGPTLAGVLLGATFPTAGLVVITVLFGLGVALLFATRPRTSNQPTPDRQPGHALADLRDGLMLWCGRDGCCALCCTPRS